MNTSVNSCGPGAQRWARGAHGFSLIELMVVVVILAIVAAIAIPSYRQYVLQSHRTDAQRVLVVNAQILQRCYTQNFTYNGCPNLATTSPNGYYTVANVVPAAGTSYTLTATATGSQTADSNCASFTVDQTELQTALSAGGANTSTTCWGGT